MPREPRAEDDPILTAAGALLDEGGDFTMAAVAERAGVSRGTVYRRYADRDTLLARLAEARGVSVAALGVDPRTRALDAVEALVAEGGLAAVTIEAVARRAGLGPATVYRHFTDRRGLLSAFASARSPRRLAPLLDGSDGADLEGDLSRFAEAALVFCVEQPALVRLSLAPDAESAALLDTVPGGPRQARIALRDYFARQIAAGRLDGDPQWMTLALMGSVLALATRDTARIAADPTAAARFVARALIAAGRPDRPP